MQKRFLHTLMHHSISNKFDVVSQRVKTVQEVMNDLLKYTVQMIHPPNMYTLWKCFVSTLCYSLHNEVLKKGCNAKFNTISLLAWLKKHLVIIIGCGALRVQIQQ